MNILFYYDITVNPEHGGIAQVTLMIGEALRKKGYGVYYLSKRKTSKRVTDWQFYLPNISKKLDEEYYRDFVQQNNIHAVINQNGTTPYSNNAIVWSYKLEIPVLTVIHSSLYGLYGLSNHLNKLGPILKKFKLHNLLQSMMYRLFKLKYGRFYWEQIKLSAFVIVLSEKFVPEYSFFSGVTNQNLLKKVISIPNPIDVSGPKYTLSEKCNEILYVGRLSQEKQVGLLLDIWSQVQNKFQDWKLTIVGEGSEKTNLQRKVQNYNIKNVYFEGFQNPKDYYRRASIFCLTSAFEGFGIVLTEAMAYGTVPIAFNSYANACEIIDNGENGFLITPFSVDEYVERLSFLILNSDIRNRMSDAAYEKSKDFSIEKISASWINLLKSLQ